MQITWDQQNNQITVGKAVFTKYKHWKGWKAWAQYVAFENGKNNVIMSNHPKDVNKFLADTLGGAPSKMYRHFQKLQYKAFVVPYKDVFMKVGYKPGRIDTRMLVLVAGSYAICKQVYEDKLYNILPIVAITGMSPAELKKQHGPKWKVVANNSLHKNKVIAEAMLTGYHYLDEIVDLPTSVLKHWGENRHVLNEEVLRFIAHNFKGKWCKGKELYLDLNIFRDTQRMAERLGETVNYKWSPRRVREEHDRMVNEINAQKYSPKPFPVFEGMKLPCLEYKGYIATPLVSAKAIADEGTAMGHCVAGYVDAVREGRYLVYSVTKDGARSSTIGMRRGYKMNSQDSRWEFNQHYARYNRLVEDENEREIAGMVLARLNASIREEELALL